MWRYVFVMLTICRSYPGRLYRYDFDIFHLFKRVQYGWGTAKVQRIRLMFHLYSAAQQCGNGRWAALKFATTGWKIYILVSARSCPTWYPMYGHYSNCPINTPEFKLHVKKTKVCDRQIAPTNINFFISEHALSIFLAGKCRPQCRETFAWKFRCVSAWPFLASIGSFWCHNSPLEVFRTIATLPSDHIHDSPTMGIERNAMSTESCTFAYLNYLDLFKHICSYPRLVVYFKGLLELSILGIKWHI